MKHTIRQNGQITQIDCELGSGIFDKNGVEIFEGDLVTSTVNPWIKRRKVFFDNGEFKVLAHDDFGYYALTKNLAETLEVVGHVEG